MLGDGKRDWESEALAHEAAAERLELDAKHRRRVAELCRKSAEYESKSQTQG
jgi:hypothetical protein